MKRIIAFIIISALLIPLLASCMGEPDEPPSIKQLLRMGRENLEKNDGSKAYNYFHEVLAREPEHQEALYGIILALDLRVFAFVDGIIDLLFGVELSNPTRMECEEACVRVAECNVYDQTWTTPEECVNDCPWGLQKFMFESFMDGSSCEEIRDTALEWITPTSHERCVAICEDLDDCGLINPPVTFTVDECIEHCPYAYVERHSKYYDLGVCNGEDRTAFEHITKGLQVLFREIGIFTPPQTMKYVDRLIALEPEYQYKLKHYAWTLVDPPLEWKLDGRYYYSELHMSEALAHFFQTFLLLATSVNLEMNFPSIDINFNYGNPQGVQEWLAAIVRFVEILLYDPIFPLGFQLYDEPWAYDQIEESATEFGLMWSSIANMFDAMFEDTDRQEGRALSYTDSNKNFAWDEDEILTLRIGDKGVDITFDQAVAIRDFSRVLEDNFLNRTPIPLEEINELLYAFDLGAFDFIFDLIGAWCEDGTFDPSQLLYEPTQNGFRNSLQTLLEELRIVYDIVVELDL